MGEQADVVVVLVEFPVCGRKQDHYSNDDTNKGEITVLSALTGYIVL